MSEQNNQQQEQQQQPNVEDLQKQIQDLQSQIKDYEEKIQAYEDEILSEEYLKFKQSQQQGQQPQPKVEKQQPSDLPKPEEINKRIEELAGHIATMQDSIAKAFAQIDIKIAKAIHSDFMDYKEDIIRVSKEHPEWDALRCYEEVKKEKKLKEMEEQEKKQQEEEKVRKAITETGTIPSSITEKKKLSKEEAAKLAYRAVFGSS